MSENELNGEIFLGVMDLNEAKTHQIKLKSQNILINFKTHGETCTTGCKVTVEVWGKSEDRDFIQNYFNQEFHKNLGGLQINREAFEGVFDPSSSEVICQACGTKFAPTSNECPDCGLMY
jgi:hypothetical protein